MGAQDEVDAAKLRTLGCRPEAVQVVGTLPVVFGDYNITAPSSSFVASIDDHAEMECKLFFEKS